MIDAVTYGMIPSAKIANCESAPPENRFSRPSTVPLVRLKYCLIASELTPGAGTHEPKR